MPFEKGYIPWNKGLHIGFGTYHFPKGYTPWNKGRKMPKSAIEKMAEFHKTHPNSGMIKVGEHRNINTEYKIGSQPPHTGKKRPEITGKNHPLWKGGLTPINIKIRRSLEYRLWRASVFERDRFTCRFCKKKGGELEADHIKPFALFPELRFKISNGRTLCKTCHKKTDTYGGRSRK